MSDRPAILREEIIRRTARRCRRMGVTIPTFAQMRNPETVPGSIRSRLPAVGLWDVNPLNLFRITWKNDLESGTFAGINHLEIPQALTGVRARVVGLTGKFFPTGAHKVGAAFGCLIPKLVSGEFDPESHRAVWPSTGNFCRGGAFDCALLDCTAVAILPEQMSAERFAWLRRIGAEVIATPGCESNVKEIYDQCWELKKDPRNVIFNQFEEFGNPLFHYSVTGPAIGELFSGMGGGRPRLSAFISATGSAGTIAAGDYLKTLHPRMKTVAVEAQQCPTLFRNGFGDHRIEGIGDKHVPWVHNVRETDAVAAIDDEDCLRLFRLFNEPEGWRVLEAGGVPAETCRRLSLLGISGICNLLAAIKTARYYELGADDTVMTVFTDSAELYQSRLQELSESRGAYGRDQALRDFAGPLQHQRTDFFRELSWQDRQAIHNLKYYTWVEQQVKSCRELEAQWDPDYWQERLEGGEAGIDARIRDFNALVESM